jgi:hypothetical protein
MVQRHPEVVSISGDHTYWSGADEMQNVMRGRLPATLALPRGDIGHFRFPAHLPPPHSWAYGCDELIAQYRNTAADFSEPAAERLRLLIREALHRHGRGQLRRFVDKSQVYSVKMTYLEKLLEGCEPRFALVTRNPYASCYRAALGKAGDLRRYAQHMDLDQRVAICVQHWANVMKCVFEDAGQVRHFGVFRFEDFLRQPAETMRRLCEFLDLEYRDDLIPRRGDVVPFGSRYQDRWYPLRTDVNDRYLAELPDAYREMVARRCEPRARELGYGPEGEDR